MADETQITGGVLGALLALPAPIRDVEIENPVSSMEIEMSMSLAWLEDQRARAGKGEGVGHGA